MEQLSLKSYGWKCALGMEVIYILCLIGGFLPWRTVAGIQLHHAVFETLPGFTWINFNSFVLGATYMFVFAWIFAWYIVWMHNSSMEKK